MNVRCHRRDVYTLVGVLHPLGVHARRNMFPPFRLRKALSPRRSSDRSVLKDGITWMGPKGRSAPGPMRIVHPEHMVREGRPKLRWSKSTLPILLSFTLWSLWSRYRHAFKGVKPRSYLRVTMIDTPSHSKGKSPLDVAWLMPGPGRRGHGTLLPSPCASPAICRSGRPIRPGL